MTVEGTRRTTVRLGAHMSIQGGLPCAVERAAEVGATALQVFLKSARQWATRPLRADEITGFRREIERNGLTRHTLAHSSYLLNIASPDAAIWERSVIALGDELARCATVGIPYFVLHPGSHLGSGEKAGLGRVVEALDRLLGATESRADSVTVLLEITAGQGTNLGYRFEQLGWILERARATQRLGVCFDTCHALAAGYDLRDARSYRATFAAFDRAIGIERLGAFHLNDTSASLGSRVDRHEHIGQGRLGLEAFRLILNDPRFRDLPMLIETPKGKDLAEDRTNLATLRSLVRRERR